MDISAPPRAAVPEPLHQPPANAPKAVPEDSQPPTLSPDTEVPPQKPAVSAPAAKPPVQSSSPVFVVVMTLLAMAVLSAAAIMIYLNS
jgi:hypothetical protein